MPQCVYRAMAQSWRSMNDKEKEQYVDKYKVDLERYRADMKKWNTVHKGRAPTYRKRMKYNRTWLGVRFTDFVASSLSLEICNTIVI